MITAVMVEHRSVAEVATDHGVSRSWIYELLARFRTEGETALEPRSRAPKSSPSATPAGTVDLVLRLRRQIAASGHDAGADTIAWHLARHGVNLSRATIHRILTRHGEVEPEPSKRPKSSLARIEATEPNGRWQSGRTRIRLAPVDDSRGVEAQVITWLDDFTRYAVHVSAHPEVTVGTVLTSLRESVGRHGSPDVVLIDGGRLLHDPSGAGLAAEAELAAQLRTWGVSMSGVEPGESPCGGKVRRFQLTMKKWIGAQGRQPTTLAELQTLLERFRVEYNTQRPHRSLPGRGTPASLYDAAGRPLPGRRDDPVVDDGTGVRDVVRHHRLWDLSNPPLPSEG